MRALLALVLAVATGACGSPAGPSFTISGRLVDAETGRPVPRTAIYVHAHVFFGRAGAADHAEDGSFSVRLPRESLQILTIETSLSPARKSLDLGAVQGDEFAFDVILE